MAGSVNKVILVGNLGRDPEVRNANDGSKIVQLSVATSESWKDKMTGERKDRTEWHRVVVFNDRLADVCEQYLRKGSKVYLEGQLQTRKWTDQQGVEKYTTEVVLAKYRGELTMLDGRGDNAQMGQSNSGFQNQMSHQGAGQSSNQGGGSQSAAPNLAQDLEDDIPF